MDNTAVFSKLKGLVSDFFGSDPDAITRSSSASDIDGWDSIGHTMLVLEIERAFGIALSDGAASQVNTVGELADLIAGRTA